MADESFQLNLSTSSATSKARPISRQRERLQRGPTTVYVGQLHPNVDDELLFELGLQAGPVSNATVVRLRETGESRGYGFIDYEDVSAVEYACQLFNGLYVFDRAIRVKASDHGGSSAATPDVSRRSESQRPSPLERQPSSSNMHAPRSQPQLQRAPSFSGSDALSHHSPAQRSWSASEPRRRRSADEGRRLMDSRRTSWNPHPQSHGQPQNNHRGHQGHHTPTQATRDFRPPAKMPYQAPLHLPPSYQHHQHHPHAHEQQPHPVPHQPHLVQQGHRPWHTPSHTPYPEAHLPSAKEMAARLQRPVMHAGQATHPPYPAPQPHQPPGGYPPAQDGGSVWTRGRR